MQYLLYIIIALTATFVGTIPFGPINLSVVNITVKSAKSRAYLFILGAAIIEIFQALAAIFFGSLVNRFLADYSWIQWLIILAFIVAGTIYFTKKPKENTKTDRPKKLPAFSQGVLVALMNPQAIPFWLIVLGLIQQYQPLHFSGLFLLVFLLGVFIGKILGLWLYMFFSISIKKHIKEGSTILYKVFGVVLILIGFIQAIKQLIQ
ncbi:MAG: LysE family transporter [Bacteroidetes bacterium]|nr:LysE family transporter [Bacteroidota bacterium]